MVFPRVTLGPLQAVLVNTAGGVTGGDRFSTEACAQAGTQLTLTTQAAERAYRARAGETGHIRTHLSVEAGARLNWLPQETILFQGCALDRALRVDLAPTARLLLAEPLVFGRTAMGEKLTAAVFRDRIDVRRDGERIFLDALDLSGDIAAHLSRPHIAAGALAMVTLLYVAPDAEAELGPLREMLPASAGASLLQEGVLVLRGLAEDGHALRQTLVPILTRLTQGHLPRCWMI